MAMAGKTWPPVPPPAIKSFTRAARKWPLAFALRSVAK
jgi:hypothetical protein